MQISQHAQVSELTVAKVRFKIVQIDRTITPETNTPRTESLLNKDNNNNKNINLHILKISTEAMNTKKKQKNRRL